MSIEFLSPINKEVVSSLYNLSSSCIGNSIQIYSDEQNFPILQDVQVVIFGVKDGRGSVSNEGCGEDLSTIRKKFYQLYLGDWNLNIADIGNIEMGNTISDTYFAVTQTISSLIKLGKIPVLIGGGQDLTFSSYRAYDVLEQTVNLVAVDCRFDLGSVDDELNSRSYLSKIIMEHPNNLFNFSNLGYQTYYNALDEVQLLQKLYFDTYRLGEVKNVALVEPIIRDADIISIDISSIKQSDAPANYNTSVNGFTAEDVCAIARYAGLSDKVSLFGVYEFNPRFDLRGTTAELIAQMVWYFIEGVAKRAKDYPFSSKDDFEKFTVIFDNDDPINFYRSDKSGRWWMEINLISNNKSKRHALIPCTYFDYKSALEQKIPERWYKALHKLT